MTAGNGKRPHGRISVVLANYVEESPAGLVSMISAWPAYWTLPPAPEALAGEPVSVFVGVTARVPTKAPGGDYVAHVLVEQPDGILGLGATVTATYGREEWSTFALNLPLPLLAGRCKVVVRVGEDVGEYPIDVRLPEGLSGPVGQRSDPAIAD